MDYTKGKQPVMTVSGCGCLIRRIGKNTYDMEYCPKHKAAPDMYEALIHAKAILASIKGEEETFKIACNALAKAEGK